MGPLPLDRHHGGPDARGTARWDFSTNTNAAGPCPPALAALRAVDATRYPDPSYHALRERLAAWHGVAPGRIVLATSASEFIQRLTAVGARLAPGPVAVPAHAYGDYAVAAAACGRPVVAADDVQATLRWCAEPSSPLGQDAPPPADPAARLTVLDAVYAPLRLESRSAWPAAVRDHVFELISPNKALGLPGVRGAYAIAPRSAAWPVADWCAALAAAEPSWPLGAHGVALLEAWASEAAQSWLRGQLGTLRHWKTALIALLRQFCGDTRPSVTPFFCARLPAGITPAALREHEISVRDAGSFGLPGWVRLGAQPPATQAALREALRALSPRRPTGALT